MTHGLVLWAIALFLLVRGVPSLGIVALCGTLTGTTFLTKPEIFVATAASVGAALALHLLARPARRAAVILSFTTGLLLPIPASMGLLGLVIPMSRAVRGTLGAWPTLLALDLVRQPFYQNSMGLSRMPDNTRLLVRWSAGHAALLLPGLLLGLLWPR